MCFKSRVPFKARKNKKEGPKAAKIMSFGLRFIDKNLETSYKSDLFGYQNNYLRFFVISGLLAGILSWVSNKGAMDNLDAFGILFNLLNIGIFIILTIIVMVKKKISHAEVSLLVIQTVECIGFVELARKTEVYLKIYHYTMMTIFLEIVMLVPMISRCHWKFNAISAFFLNTYANIRYLNSKENQEEARIFTSSLYFLNFLIISMGSYISEKYDRNLYYINKTNEKSLKNLEFVIREIFPTSIIIYNKGKVAFHNKETLNLLGIPDDGSIEEKLFAIKIKADSRGPNRLSINKRENRRDEENSPAMGLEQNLNKLLVEGNILSDFEKYAGVLKAERNPGEKKLLEVKIGKIIWERDEALLCILTEDLASQRINYLNEQARYKDHLLATVSHDLRTPLNGIIGILELSLTFLLDKNLRKNLSLALRSSKLLLFMINDILDFSQIGMGKLSLNPTDFCIYETVKEVAKLIKFQAKIKGIDFIFDSRFPAHKRLLIHSDPNRLKQVVLNLLSNALKFTQSGFIKLTIEPKEKANYRKQNSQNLTISEGCRISVEDTGSGIKEEDLPKLFQLFGKLESHHNRRVNPTGVGLGLAISQQLVHYLNKNSSEERKGISVVSEFGKGSNFSFVIQSMKEEEARCSPAALAENEPPPEENFSESDGNNLNRNKVLVSQIPKYKKITLDKKHVLLVDDDQINITVLKTYFKNFEDCDYDTAFNGKAAVDLIKKRAEESFFYDIIFMDCNMPILDGFEATKIILELVEQQVIPSLPIVASTANVSKTDLESCTKAGMADFISKPFSQAEVRKKLNKWVIRD